MKRLTITIDLPDGEAYFNTAANIVSNLALDFARRGYDEMIGNGKILRNCELVGEWSGVASSGACPRCYEEHVEAGNGVVEGVLLGDVCEHHLTVIS